MPGYVYYGEGIGSTVFSVNDVGVPMLTFYNGSSWEYKYFQLTGSVSTSVKWYRRFDLGVGQSPTTSKGNNEKQ